MTIELHMLVASAVFGLAQVLIAATPPALKYGFKWALSSRDTPMPALKSKVAARLRRASRNFLETFPMFIAAVLAVQMSGHHTAMTALGAQLYFWGRVAYVPAYALDAVPLRTILWGGSMVGILLLFSAVLCPH